MFDIKVGINMGGMTAAEFAARWVEGGYAKMPDGLKAEIRVPVSARTYVIAWDEEDGCIGYFVAHFLNGGVNKNQARGGGIERRGRRSKTVVGSAAGR